MLIQTDVLIIGSGAAGLTAALELADKLNVLIISKETLVDSSTWYAQGGIAAVLAKEDTTESHIKDTLIAGDGLCDEKAVRFIKWLKFEEEGIMKKFGPDGVDYFRYAWVK